MQLVGSVLFLLFLKNLARYIRRSDLAARSIRVLVMGVATIIVAVGLVAMPMMGRHQEVGMVSFGLLVMGIVLLIMYGNLLTYLRKAVLQHNQSPPPV